MSKKEGRERPLSQVLLYEFLETAQNGSKELTLEFLARKNRSHIRLWRKDVSQTYSSIVAAMQNVKKNLLQENPPFVLLKILRDGKSIEGWKIADKNDPLDVIRLKQEFGESWEQKIRQQQEHNARAKKAEVAGLLTRKECRAISFEPSAKELPTSFLPQLPAHQ